MRSGLDNIPCDLFTVDGSEHEDWQGGGYLEKFHQPVVARAIGQLQIHQRHGHVRAACDQSVESVGEILDPFNFVLVAAPGKSRSNRPGVGGVPADVENAPPSAARGCQDHRELFNHGGERADCSIRHTMSPREPIYSGSSINSGVGVEGSPAGMRLPIHRFRTTR